MRMCPVCEEREIYSPPEATYDDIIEFDMEHKIGKSDVIEAATLFSLFG